MKPSKRTALLLFIPLLTILGINGCTRGNGGPAENNSASEKALAPEKNPPGDIPDSQVFIPYAPEGEKYKVEVPEGWARKTAGNQTAFTSHFDGVSITTSAAESAPTVETVQSNWAEKLKQSGKAVKITKIKAVTVFGSPAVLCSYESNSKPDSVTNKQVRLENHAYLFYKNGQLAVLRLWAPLGSDNVDQWQYISKSFRWR